MKNLTTMKTSKHEILKAHMSESKLNTCAILRSNGNEIEILNGADPNTLGVILNIIGKS